MYKAVPEGSKLWLVDISTPSHVVANPPKYDGTLAQHFEIPGCERKAVFGMYAGSNSPCRISPCVYEAVKALQAQQAARATNTHKLEDTMGETKNRDISVPEPVSRTSRVLLPVAERVLKWFSGVRT